PLSSPPLLDALPISFEGVAKAGLGGVDRVDRADLRRDRVGHLIRVLPLPALGFLRGAQVGVSIDEAGQDPLPTGIDLAGICGDLDVGAEFLDPAVLDECRSGEGLAFDGYDVSVRDRKQTHTPILPCPAPEHRAGTTVR